MKRVLTMVVTLCLLVGSVALLTDIADARFASKAEAAAFLEQGSSGDAVKALQSALMALDYNPGRVDGIFGPKTENAVMAYQTGNGLESDGVVTEQLYNAIINASKLAGKEIVPLVNFAEDSRLEAITTENGVTYTPAENGNYTLSGSASVAGVIGLIPQELPWTIEGIRELPDILTLEKGNLYQISGIQLVCTTDIEGADLVIINTCIQNRTVADALIYEATENLHVKEIRVYYDEGDVYTGNYEPSFMLLK